MYLCTMYWISMSVFSDLVDHEFLYVWSYMNKVHCATIQYICVLCTRYVYRETVRLYTRITHVCIQKYTSIYMRCMGYVVQVKKRYACACVRVCCVRCVLCAVCEVCVGSSLV